MKTFILAIVAMVGISYGAAIALETLQRTSDRAYVGAGAKPDAEPSLADPSRKH